MDKYEFKLSLGEINTLIDERRFDEAAGIADKIDWSRVKSANTLCRISEVYKIVGDYDRSRDIMAIAYQRQPDNPAIVYALCELTIYLYNRDGMQSDLTFSLQLLNEYQKMEPGNPKRHILQYKMYCASPVSNEEKTAVLKQLHEEKPSARWDYELARVYSDGGNREEAVKAARDVIRRYSGKYADKAQHLLEELGETGVEEAGEEETASAESGIPSGSDGKREQSNPAAEESPEAAGEGAGDASADGGDSRNEAGNSERIPEESAGADRKEREKTPAEEGTAGSNVRDGQQGLPITTPEEQHGVDSLQKNVANGMKDILARPYDDKLEQETSGQYAIVMDQPQEPDHQVAGQMSISEVMAEWEKIRSDIRKANDQKRAQRILEDTGTLLADFDETARHGLLEDIEKGVARQRRQVRSGAYRVSDALPQEQYADAEHQGGDNNRPAEIRQPAEERTDTADTEEGYFDDGEEEAAGRNPQEDSGSSDDNGAEDPEQDHVRIYHSSREADELDDVETRRWNSEEIRRAMARQEQIVREEELRSIRRSRGTDVEQEDNSGFNREADEETAESVQEAVSAEEGENYPDKAPVPELSRERGETTSEEKMIPEQSAETLPEDPEDQENPEEELPAQSEEDDETEEPADNREELGPDEASTEQDQLGELEPVRSPETEEKASPQKEQNAGAAAGQKARRELTKEERRLFGPFCRMKANVSQLLEALDQISLASSTGNVMILGNEATADRVAKGILEIERHSDSNFTGKIAKVSGGSLNKLDAGGFTRTFAKLENGALIINKASDIAPKAMERLYQELEGRDHGIILIMTDTYRKMDQFRRENAKYLGSFTAVINIRPLDDKALVAYARDYAMSQDYSIDEFGQLALAQRISSMQTSAHRVTLKEVRDLVDEAISYASRKTPHTLMEILSRKRYDENDRIIIHEKDFQHY